MGLTQQQLRRFLAEKLNDSEIRTLVFDYFGPLFQEIDVSGLKHSERVLALMQYVLNRDRLDLLEAALYDLHGAQMNQAFGPPSKSSQPDAQPSSTITKKPRQIFISHAGADADLARRLAADFSARGYPVWIAPDSINPGEPWVKAINRGLEESENFLLLMSPAAILSRWVETEASLAIEMEHDGEMRFVPLLVRPCTPPRIWRRYQHIILEDGYENGLAQILHTLGSPTPDPARPKPTPEKSVKKQAAAPPRIEIVAPEPEAARGPAAPPAIHGIEWIFIPAGEFWMGDDNMKNSSPCHRLHLESYWISKTPITNRQYLPFVNAVKDHQPSYWKKNLKEVEVKNDHPVVEVTWDDALAYGRWLGEQIGRPVALPSEAEWEKAARGQDDKRVFPWGDEFDPAKCNTEESGIGGTSAVDRYPNGASPYGVLDMTGNVWEWTRSLWGKSYPYLPGVGREDLAAPDAVARVVRGGAWVSPRNSARVAYRLRSYPYVSDYLFGFRLVSPVVF